MAVEKISSDFDVAIIGASLSGSVAAYILGRTGMRVALIDPLSFPRLKACGEGLSDLGQRYLEALGLWSHKLARSAYPFYGYRINLRSGACIDPQSSKPYGFGISRVDLDSSVYRRASSLSTVMPFTDTVRGLYEGSSTRKIKAGSHGTISAQHVVLACGAGAARLAPESTPSDSGSPRYGIALWFTGQWQDRPPASVSISHEEEGQYIITPLDKERVNLSILLSHSKNGEGQLSRSEITDKAIKIAGRSGFNPLSLTETRGAPAIHTSRARTQSLKEYLIGDAVERFDPIGGMGMTHAIFSAVLASGAILNAKKTSAQTDSLAAYYRAREQGVRELRLLTSLSYALNVSEQKWLQVISARSPRLTAGIVSLLKGSFPTPSDIIKPGHSQPLNQQVYVPDYHTLTTLRSLPRKE